MTATDVGSGTIGMISGCSYTPPLESTWASWFARRALAGCTRNSTVRGCA